MTFKKGHCIILKRTASIPNATLLQMQSVLFDHNWNWQKYCHIRVSLFPYKKYEIDLYFFDHIVQDDKTFCSDIIGGYSTASLTPLQTIQRTE